VLGTVSGAEKRGDEDAKTIFQKKERVILENKNLNSFCSKKSKSPK